MAKYYMLEITSFTFKTPNPARVLHSDIADFTITLKPENQATDPVGWKFFMTNTWITKAEESSGQLSSNMNIGAPFWGLLLGFLVSRFIEK